MLFFQRVHIQNRFISVFIPQQQIEYDRPAKSTLKQWQMDWFPPSASVFIGHSLIPHGPIFFFFFFLTKDRKSQIKIYVMWCYLSWPLCFVYVSSGYVQLVHGGEWSRRSDPARSDQRWTEARFGLCLHWTGESEQYPPQLYRNLKVIYRKSKV